MQNFLYDLNRELIQRGYNLREQIQLIPGKWQRFSLMEKKQSKKDFFLIIYDDYSGASFGYHPESSHAYNWFHKNKYSTLPVDYSQIRESRLKAESEREHRFNLAVEKCLSTWNNTKEANINHPYLVRKKIPPIICRQFEDKIIVPVHTINGNLTSLQSISENGFKKFYPDGVVKKSMCFLPGDTSIYFICEGFATGVTLNKIFKVATLVAFSASNLVNVACLLRDNYSKARIIIAADNDEHKEKNTGLIEGLKASKLIRSLIRYPKFNQCDKTTNPTDFNDLYQLAGTDEVINQILKI